MIITKFDSLWKLLSEHTFDVQIESSDDDVICTICNKLIINAHHISCGCQCCYTCITENLSSGNLLCVRCNVDHSGDVLISNCTNVKVSKLIGKCCNESCDSYIELIEMEKHLKDCPKQIMLCPFNSLGCQFGEATKEIVVKHLKDDAMRHTDLLMGVMHSMTDDMRRLRSEIGDSRKEVKLIREEARRFDTIDRVTPESNNTTMHTQVGIISQQLSEQKRELATMREVSRNQDARIGVLEENLMELRNEMESRVSMIRGNSAA